MLFQSSDLFEKDIEYLGKRYEGREDVTLYIANTNMSLFKEDFEIAYLIKSIQNKYGWPKLINVNSGKDSKKLLKMMDIITWIPALAIQSLNEDVLKDVKNAEKVSFPMLSVVLKEISYLAT